MAVAQPVEPATETIERKKRPDKVNKFDRLLPCDLTAKEVAERADKAARLYDKTVEKKETLKAHTALINGEIKAALDEHKILNDEVITRTTNRMVDCEERLMYDEGIVITSRLDTFGTLDHRKMSESERQLDLFPQSQAKGPEYPEEMWRPIAIEEALKGLPKKVCAAFEKANINTMGDFSDFQAKKGEFWVKDLDGVGPGGAEKISDAAIDFWKRLAERQTTDAAV